MRFEADTVEHEDFKVAKAVHRIGRDRFKVGGVGEIVESVCDDRQLAVDHFERRYFDLFSDAEGRVVHDRVRDQLRKATAEMCRLEDVLEDAAKVDPRYLVCEDRHCPVSKIKGANVVEAEDVVNVTVRDQHRVELSDIRPQRLLAKVTRGVDEYCLAAVFDQYRNSQTLVPRILGNARLTVARDRRYAGGCACSKEGKFHATGTQASRLQGA